VADKVEKLAKIAKRTSEQAAQHTVIVARVKEERERRSESMAKKRAVRQASQATFPTFFPIFFPSAPKRIHIV